MRITFWGAERARVGRDGGGARRDRTGNDQALNAGAVAEGLSREPMGQAASSNG